jgi:hypothetical protein
MTDYRLNLANESSLFRRITPRGWTASPAILQHPPKYL